MGETLRPLTPLGKGAIVDDFLLLPGIGRYCILHDGPCTGIEFYGVLRAAIGDKVCAYRTHVAHTVQNTIVKHIY
jgi:hypothetical protein